LAGGFSGVSVVSFFVVSWGAGSGISSASSFPDEQPAKSSAIKHSLNIFFIYQRFQIVCY
jgi:hypothetical protein